MAPAPFSVERQISTTLRKFKFEELESMVLPIFPETSWNKIRSTLVKHHESFTPANVLRIIVQTIRMKQIDDDDLRERLTYLEVIEISRHSQKKYWYGYELKEKKGTFGFTSLEELRQKMLQVFHTMKMKMEIKLITYDGATFISMREKKSIRSIPLFFALFLSQGYFFSSRKAVKSEFLYVISESMGYSSYKKLHLMGRHLESLMKMLQIKKQGIANAEKLCDSSKYEEAPPVIKNTGIDFRQHQNRKKYIEKIFGDEQPTIDVLDVKKNQVPWADKDIATLLPNTRINMEWEFKSHDIAGFLGQLAEKRVLTNPLPDYITKFMENGMNELKIKNE